MALAPYQRTYRRARTLAGNCPSGYLPNPACHLTDQGADPDPADLAWCIRRRWRVIYYSARRAAGQPLWDGVDDFEALLGEVLLRMSSRFEPIQPAHSPESHRSAPTDARKGRFYQPSCRILPAPVFEKRPRID
jgi:hypothetical protein